MKLFMLLGSYGFSIHDWDDGTIRIEIGSIVHYINTKHRCIDDSEPFIKENIELILNWLLEHGDPVDNLNENKDSPDYGCINWRELNVNQPKTL